MKKQITLLMLIMLPFYTRAQTVNVISTGFDNTPQQSGWTEFRKGVVSTFQEWDFTGNGAYSAPYSLTHFYPVGGASVMDDWEVSPPIDLSSGGVLDSLRYLFTGFGTPQAGDTVALYLLSGSADPALATGKILLKDFRGTDYQNDNVWRKLTALNIPAMPGNTHLAFRYVTVNNWLDVKLDNVSVSVNSGTLLTELGQMNGSLIFPNPSSGEFKFKTSYLNDKREAVIWQIYDLSGKILYNTQGLPNGNVQLELEDGMYWMCLWTEKEGLISRNKFQIVR